MLCITEKERQTEDSALGRTAFNGRAEKEEPLKTQKTNSLRHMKSTRRRKRLQAKSGGIQDGPSKIDSLQKFMLSNTLLLMFFLNDNVNNTQVSAVHKFLSILLIFNFFTFLFPYSSYPTSCATEGYRT